MTAKLIDITASIKPPIAPHPPVAHAPSTGGIATKTAASPPNAAKPMIPTLNNPAYPH